MSEKTFNFEYSSEFLVGLCAPLIVAGVIAAVTPVTIVRAWVLTKLWDWYLTPAFGAQPLRVIYAFGIISIVTFLMPMPPKSDQKLAKSLAVKAMEAALVLLIGWLGTWFI